MQISRLSFARKSQGKNPKGVAIANAQRFCAYVGLIFVGALMFLSSESSAQEAPPHSLELSRPIRTWEFLPVTGTRAALFGNESGQMEAWIYPLKLLRDLGLIFHEGDHAIPAEVLARTIIVRPESATIVYSSDTFTVRETFFVPGERTRRGHLLRHPDGQPLEIEARFVRDFQLEWPAAIGGTFIEWDKNLHAFALGEETQQIRRARRFADGRRSRAGIRHKLFRLPGEHDAAWRDRKRQRSETNRDFRFGEWTRRSGSDISPSARTTTNSSAGNPRNTTKIICDDTVNVALPDAQLQQAYDWSRVSVLQGMVTNPYLGTGLVAGYRTSGESRASGICMVFRARFDVDFVRAEFRSAISPTRERRSTSSASSSVTTEKSRTKFRRRPASSIGSINFITDMHPPTQRRYTSSR